MEIVKFVRNLLLILVFSFLDNSDASCSLPSSLQGDWTDSSLAANVTLTTNKLTGYSLMVSGSSYSSHTCISNINNVYVFRGDNTYVDGGTLLSLPYFLCMKIERVTDNLYYYHLLSDKSGTANNKRVYLPNSDPATTATCDYCIFSQPHVNECILLQKAGTSETITCAEAALCLPCEKDCSASSGNSETTDNESDGPVIAGAVVGATVAVGVGVIGGILIYKKFIAIIIKRKRRGSKNAVGDDREFH